MHESETDHPWVWRVTSASRLARTPVPLGLRSGTWVQLNSGLAAGERVLASAGAGLREGQRVRPSLVDLFVALTRKPELDRTHF
mgnify:CR=1 FL=1